MCTLVHGHTEATRFTKYLREESADDDDGRRLQQKHTTITSHWNVAICMPSGAFGWAFREPEGTLASIEYPAGNGSSVEGPTMTK